jgi:G:T-mismatch repair DNA endonuclease (very short patch repair protein)
MTRMPYDYKPNSSRWESTTQHLLVASRIAHESDRSVMHGLRSNGQSAFCVPDITIYESRIAIFLDGCYWHGCPEHYPSQRRAYDDTISGNLRSRGWSVLRIWEHEGPHRAAELAVEFIEAVRAA